MELPTLQEFIDSVGWIEATVALNKVEPTLRTRLRSGRDWRVVTVNGVNRCALVDSV